MINKLEDLWKENIHAEFQDLEKPGVDDARQRKLFSGCFVFFC